MRPAEVFRYGLKGGAFVALNITAQILLVESGLLSPPIAAAVSTAAMPLLGYVAMNRFVFPDAGAVTGWRYLKRFGQYYAVNLLSKVFNYGIFLGLYAIGVWYPLAYLIGAAAVFLATFTINRWLWHGSVRNAA